MATLVVVVRDAPGAVASGTPDQHILVPSYIVPGSGWNGIASSYPTVGIALLNVDSGPGSAAETSFKNQVATEEAAGIAMYAYVSSDYGDVALSSVETQINDYASWYGVHDIFVDEAPTNCGTDNDVASYYQPLYTYIHAHGGDEILNPGTANSTSSCYMAVTDILDTFEGSYTSYMGYTPAQWTSGYAASRFFNEVYDTPTEGDMVSVLDHLETLNAGWVYVTNLNTPNPYNALPSYWTDEVDTVSSQETTTTGVTPTTTKAPPPPVVASVGKVVPRSGSATGGTEVIITGTGFSGTTQVMFGTNRHGSLPAKSFTVNSTGTTIIAYSPAEKPGRVNIRVITPAGTSAVKGADKFRFAGEKNKNK
jgi:Spherulation-specific family 4/IPT/TIG domain